MWKTTKVIQKLDDIEQFETLVEPHLLSKRERYNWKRLTK